MPWVGCLQTQAMSPGGKRLHAGPKIVWQDQNADYSQVITHLEPDILECEMKWALESITTPQS